MFTVLSVAILVGSGDTFVALQKSFFDPTSGKRFLCQVDHSLRATATKKGGNSFSYGGKRPFRVVGTADDCGLCPGKRARADNLWVNDLVVEKSAQIWGKALRTIRGGGSTSYPRKDV